MSLMRLQQMFHEILSLIWTKSLYLISCFFHVCDSSFVVCFELALTLVQNHISMCIVDDMTEAFLSLNILPSQPNSLPLYYIFISFVSPFELISVIVVITSYQPLAKHIFLTFKPSLWSISSFIQWVILGIIAFKVALVCRFVEGSMLLSVWIYFSLV